MSKYFMDVIKNHYVDFTGRATRTQFWMFALWSIIIYMVLAVLLVIAGKISGTLASVMGIVAFIFALGIILPSIAIQVRRVRDLGISGWWTLLGIVFSPILLIFDLLPTNVFGGK